MQRKFSANHLFQNNLNDILKRRFAPKEEK